MKHQLAIAACATVLLSLPGQAGQTGQFVLPPYAAIQNQIVEGGAWKALREMVAGDAKLQEFRDPHAVSTKAGGTVREGQLMIRDPNFTGMQVKTGTLDDSDRRFLDKTVVKLGDDLLLRMRGGFSLSETPASRFKFKNNGAEGIAVYAHGAEGAEFTHSFPLNFCV